jgi:hypothetical protein
MADQYGTGEGPTGGFPDPNGTPQPGGWQQPGPPAAQPGQWSPTQQGHGQPPAYAPPGYGPSAYGPPAYGTTPGYGGYPVVGQRTNGMAVASMVLGILWIYWIGSILALVFGYTARKQIQERGEGGAGMATAGIVLGWVGVGILGFVILLGIAASA